MGSDDTFRETVSVTGSTGTAKWHLGLGYARQLHHYVRQALPELLTGALLGRLENTGAPEQIVYRAVKTCEVVGACAISHDYHDIKPLLDGGHTRRLT